MAAPQQKIGQYEILERVAVGGMAEVYRGRVLGAEGFEKYVAIKRVLPHLSEDARFVEMLLIEARIHSTLSHRNIVQIHDLGVTEEGEYFIVLEYVEGRDLRALLDALAAKRERMPELLALSIASEIAQGLHFAHEMRGPDGQPLGLVHRDVSPSNILLSYAGEVKLSDFGLAKRRQDHSVVGSLKGKLAYMSPEQARRQTLDRRSDVFSLGAVLWEMLTGKRLREITDEVSGWRDVASGRLPDLRAARPDLPDGFDRMLERALAADPAQRFPDGPTFTQAIQNLVLQISAPLATPSAADLKKLLARLLPPGSPRTDHEFSKVIRFASSLMALPLKPPPVPLDALDGDPTVRAETPVPVDAEGDITLRTPPPRTVPYVPRPAPARPFALAPLLPSPLPPSRPTPPPASPPPPRVTPKRNFRSRDISRTTVLRRGSWRRKVAALGILMAAAAVAVHVWVVPIGVLLVWGRTAQLAITSDPPGASVRLDGVPLRDPTPTRAPVNRDAREHAVELSRPGFKTAVKRVRYDRSVELSVGVTLAPLEGPAIRPIARPQR